jgi:putative membrane protein
MSEPLKPRIDFTGPLEAETVMQVKAAQTFSDDLADNFAPVNPDEIREEGPAEAAVEAALHPKRSLWRKMVLTGMALFGASVVGQGVQWAMNAWQTQDWVAMGGCAAGALIVGAGVGSVATEWRRLWRLRQRAQARDEARELLHSHGTGKGAHFVKIWRARPGLIMRILRCSAGMPRFMRHKMTGKWSRCMPISFSRCWITRRGVKSAARRLNQR